MVTPATTGLTVAESVALEPTATGLLLAEASILRLLMVNEAPIYVKV